MIDKLIQRLAAKHPAPSSELGLQLQPRSTSLMPGDSGDDAAHPHDAAHDPFHAGYVPSRPPVSAHTGQTLPGDASAWSVAVQAQLRQDSAALMAQQPGYFSDWGPAHLAVAQLLWSERAAMHAGLMQITCGSQLLAVVNGALRQVAIQPCAFDKRSPLLWEHHSGDSEPIQASRKANFQNHHLHTLMWYFGQANPASPEHLPEEVATGRIQLRRFPQVVPAALAMRHLALIHQFSRGAMSFTQLQRQTELEHQAHLCADVASLFLTGTLRFLPPLPSESA